MRNPSAKKFSFYKRRVAGRENTDRGVGKETKRKRGRRRKGKEEGKENRKNSERERRERERKGGRERGNHAAARKRIRSYKGYR